MLRNLVHRSAQYSAVFNHRPILPLSFRRYLSSKPDLVEIELDFELDLSAPSVLSKMEELIQKLMVRRATPDWLPFRPGSSFWVPPPHLGTKKVVDLVEKLSNRLSDEEYLSVTSDRGWPCLDSFIDADKSGDEATSVDVKSSEEEGEVVEVVVLSDSKDES